MQKCPKLVTIQYLHPGRSKCLNLINVSAVSGTMAAFQIRIGNFTEDWGEQGGFELNPLCHFSLAVDLTTMQLFGCRQNKTGRYISIEVVDPIVYDQMILCEVNVVTI